MKETLKETLEEILQHPRLFEVFLNEDVNQKVLNEFNLNEMERTLGNLNHQPALILSLQKEDDQYLGLIKVNDQVIGWTELKHSYLIYPKKLESVKINLSTFRTHPFNQAHGIKSDLILTFKDRLLSSRKFIKVDGDYLELIYIKGRLKGFVASEDLYRGLPVDEPFTLSEAVLLYRDSNFDIDYDKEFIQTEARMTLLFPELNLAKIEYGNLSLWAKATDIDPVFIDETSVRQKLEIDHYEWLMLERDKSKSVITALLKNQLMLERKLQKQEERLARVQTLYDNLKQSRLGRMQVAFWERKKRGRK